MKQAPKSIDVTKATKAQLVQKLAECAVFIKACGKEMARLEALVKDSEEQIKTANDAAAALNLEMTRQDHVHQDELESIHSKIDKLLTSQKQ